VKPEANVYLGWMLRHSDDLLDLREAFSKVLIRVVVAMWLGVATEHISIQASERRRIAGS